MYLGWMLSGVVVFVLGFVVGLFTLGWLVNEQVKDLKQKLDTITAMRKYQQILDDVTKE